MPSAFFLDDRDAAGDELDELVQTHLTYETAMLVSLAVRFHSRYPQGMPPSNGFIDPLMDSATLEKAELPHLTVHDLRHVNASLRLVNWGEEVVYVSSQLGHSDPSITCSVYAHLIDRARHAAEARAAMEALA
jgi:integrase